VGILESIGPSVQQVAEAISAALGVETEIVDDELTIVAGTGKYQREIGTKEEGGRREADFMYARVLRTGEPCVVEDPASDPTYDPTSLVGETDEVGEICCPIKMGERVIGVVGLVAFDPEQRGALLGRRQRLLYFLEKMALLLASKARETMVMEELTLFSNRLRTIIETIHEGVIAIDHEGIITHCNPKAEVLVERPRKDLVGTHIAHLWPASPILDVLRTGQGYTEREEIHHSGANRRHLVVTSNPIMAGGRVVGAVASFRGIAEVRKLVYNISSRSEISSFDDIQGESEAIRSLKAQARQISRGNSTVLVTGESGTGKELLARAIHCSSPRAAGPFITVNCGAIPESLLESELFGYEGGAFTGARKEGKPGKFELADGGTIFLDEIGDLPLHLQAKLLHVLQLRTVDRVGGTRAIPVDVRVIAATNRDLDTMIGEGEFRSDLYFRLNVIPLAVPPLRERPEDIPVLLNHCLSRHTTLLGKRITGFHPQVMAAFTAYDWPGNVRELENAVEYAVNMETGSVVTLERVPQRIRKATFRRKEDSGSLKSRLQRHEREILEELLARFGQGREGKEKVARTLGISRATLYRKMVELGISSPL
jgi:PAS domain S-box-containing protein